MPNIDFTVSDFDRPLQFKIYSDICSCICTIYHNGSARVMLIDSVRTKRSFRNQGYATMLIVRALELAREYNVDSVELTVNESNEAAKKLYKKTGFEKTDKEYHRILLNRR